MSVRLNLLPDVRLAKIRSARNRHLILGTSILLWALVGGVAVLLGVIQAAEHLQLSSVNSKIASNKATLAGYPKLPDALSAQAALATLPQLYANRTFFSKFLAVLDSSTPTTITLSQLSQASGNQLTAQGTADSLYTVNKFVAALAAAGASASGSGSTPYFSNIQLGAVSLDTTGKVSFTITTTVSSGAFASLSLGTTP